MVDPVVDVEVSSFFFCKGQVNWYCFHEPSNSSDIVVKSFKVGPLPVISRVTSHV